MKRQLIIILYLSLLLLTSCQKNETSVLNNSSHPYFIEAYLESGQTGIVHISATKEISSALQGTFLTRDQAANFYKNLNVTVLLLKDNLVVDTLNQLSCQGKDFLISKLYDQTVKGNVYSWNDTATRYWYLQGKNHLIKEGGTYKMIVRIPTHPDMVAICNIPQKVTIQKLDTIINGGCQPFFRDLIKDTIDNSFTNESLFYWVSEYSFQLTITDPSSVQNYYQIETYYNFRTVTSVNYPYYRYDSRFTNFKFTTYYAIRENPIFENKNNFTNNYPFFSDKLFDGRQITLDLNLKTWTGDSLVYFNLVSMSQGYYERKKSEDLFIANMNNTYASPTELYGNFTNAVGFLAGRSVSKDTFKLILHNTSIHY